MFANRAGKFHLLDVGDGRDLVCDSLRVLVPVGVSVSLQEHSIEGVGKMWRTTCAVLSGGSIGRRRLDVTQRMRELQVIPKYL